MLSLQPLEQMFHVKPHPGSTIAHFERKFTSPTETFIVNQIVAANQFDHAVFTIRSLNNLPVFCEVYAPEKIGFTWQFKMLGGQHRKYLSMQLDKVQPSLIHSHYLTDAAFFHPLTKKYRLPKVCSAYGYDVSRFPKRLGVFSRMFFKNIFSEYTFFIAMSEDMRKDIIALGCPSHKVIVHYHGVDTASFHVDRALRQSDEPFNILTIGNLEEKKGHVVSLKAIEALQSLLPKVNIKYRIVGNGHLKDSLKSFVASTGLSEIVELCEAVKHGSEFLNHLKSAHAFLHPSNITADGDKEGIPGAIVEAMASGLPVISTVHAGIPEVIKHDVTGFLVQEKDHVAIAKYLKVLYDDVQLAFTIGQQAKQYACENLDIHQRATKLQDIYKLALGDS